MKLFKSAVPFPSILVLALVGIAAFSGGAFGLVNHTVDPVQYSAAAVVKVSLKGGHGSGVHLGNGYVLTAGHVTTGAREVAVRTPHGEPMRGEVIAINYDDLGRYDVSLVYVPELSGMPSAPLSCKAPYIGQSIRIVGNPSGDEFAFSWGRVSNIGVVGYVENGWWRRLVGMDITAAPGVSGGPVFDEITGEVVGILVAGMVTDRGTFGYSYMVPGDAICHVMGRSA